MRLSFVSCCLCLLVLLHGSCTYNKADILYPIPCDTTNVKYSTDIQPLLNSNCNSCHGTGGQYAPELGDYNQVKEYIDNNPGGMENSINGTNNYTPMPKNGAKMSDCNIHKFEIWIRNGAPNN